MARSIAGRPAAGGLVTGPVVREACVAALVSLVLFVPLMGMETTSGQDGLTIVFHPLRVAIAVAAVVALKLAVSALRAGGTGLGAPFAVVGNAFGAVFRQAAILGAAGILFAFVFPFLPFANRYTIDVATTVLIYVMLGWGLNIVVGLAGLLDLGYVAFYAVGAYSFALLSSHFGLGFWACLPLAGLFAASFGIVLGFPVLRLRGDYLAIVTLGFGEIVRIVLLNWSEVTGGPNGLSVNERPSLFGLEFTRRASGGGTTFHDFFNLTYSTEQRVAFLYYVILVLALLTNFFVLRIRKLPIGRAWEALREDEVACKALGINPTSTKLTAFALGAMFGGFAGSFFATRQGFISPESFTFIESAIILSIVVLGGMGSQVGVVLAATVIVVLPELGREFAQFRMLLFGAAMVGIMVWRPSGLMSHREPTLRLRKGRGGGAPPDRGPASAPAAGGSG